MSYDLTITQVPEYSLTITGDCPDYSIAFELVDTPEYEVTFEEIAVVNIENVSIGDYVYHAAAVGEDTAGDWRQYADASGFYTEVCTVGAATKGGGTWAVKFTIQA
jgi:hypothetical protein